MRKWAIALTVVALAGCGEKVAQVELNDGNIITPRSWDKDYVIVNYWAEWCEPCREEIPELNKLVQGFPPERVLGINFDQPDTVELGHQIARMGINFPVVVQGSLSWLPHERPTALPATYLFGPQGQLVKVFQGPQTAATLLYHKQQHLSANQ